MSALSGVDIALWDLKGLSINIIPALIRVANGFHHIGKNLKVPVFELLGGKVRSKVQVYCWIGGDRPSDVERAAYV
jgi:galactonate dehydratase